MPATIHCSTCQAACCRMQVMIIDDTGMPDRFIETDASGSQSMRRLDDGWCEALNRNTFLCDQYDVRPTICREFDRGGADCQSTRVDVTAPWMGDEPTGLSDSEIDSPEGKGVLANESRTD